MKGELYIGCSKFYLIEFTIRVKRVFEPTETESPSVDVLQSIPAAFNIVVALLCCNFPFILKKLKTLIRLKEIGIFEYMQHNEICENQLAREMSLL